MPRNKARRLEAPLPKDFIACGQLTLDPSQPQNNSILYPSNLPLDVRSAPMQDVHAIQGTAISANLTAQLMTFLTSQARALRLDHVQVHVPEATRYLVWSSEPAFKKACGRDDIRSWLEEHVINEGRKAVMIVGMYTYSNATYVHTKGNGLAGGISVSMPTDVATARLAAGADGAALDHHTFGMQGEHVFAIEYRRVRFRSWTKKKIADAKLEDGPNRWEVFFGDRSKGAAAADEKENIVEFSLVDDGLDDDRQEDETDDDDDDLDKMDEEENGKEKCTSFEGSKVDDHTVT